MGRTRGERMTTAVVLGAAACSVLLAAAAAAGAGRLAIDPAASKVEFLLKTTWHDVHGHTTAVKGTISTASGDPFADGRVTVSIDAAALSTGIAMRDKKMREECLQTQTYPTIEFVSTSAPSIEGSTREPDGGYRTVSLKLRGTLTVHGVKHEVTLPANVHRDGAAWVITGELKLKLTEYSIPDPSILFNHVQDQVTVTFTVRASPSQD